MKKRKKICPHCGRKLWLRDFYLLKKGCRSSWCAECQRANKRSWYNRLHKKPDGLRYDPGTGRTIDKKGLARRIHWSGQMLSDLRRMFPTEPNKEVAEYVGVSVRTLIRKARELGLRKDPDWLHQMWEDNRRLAHFVSRARGYPGGFQERPESGAHTRLKKGHQLTSEQKAKQSESMKCWYRRHPFAARKKSAKLFKAVRCIETGQEWQSVGDACRAVGVSRSYFSHYLNQRKPLRGLNYEFVKPNNEQKNE